MSEELARRIRTVRFTPVRAREGYDMGEVDMLLDRLEEAALEGGDLTALVDGARFTPVRLREGYEMGEVDAFLDEVCGRAPAASSPSHPSVIEERPGLLQRIFGRRRGGSW